MSTTVEVGQVWADNDKRGYGRQVRIVEIFESRNPAGVTERFAYVEQVSARGMDDGKPGRRTRIRVDRFRPTTTGYRLVEASGERCLCPAWDPDHNDHTVSEHTSCSPGGDPPCGGCDSCMCGQIAYAQRSAPGDAG